MLTAPDLARPAACPGALTVEPPTAGRFGGRHPWQGGSATVGSVWGGMAGILAIVAVAWALQFDPPRAVRLPWSTMPLPELCGSQRWLGIDCPGCGLTRSFILAARGRWSDAWQMHGAGTVAFAFLLGLLPYRLWQGWRIAAGHPPPDTMGAELLILVGLLGVQTMAWIARTGIDLLG